MHCSGCALRARAQFVCVRTCVLSVLWGESGHTDTVLHRGGCTVRDRARYSRRHSRFLTETVLGPEAGLPRHVALRIVFRVVKAIEPAALLPGSWQCYLLAQQPTAQSVPANYRENMMQSGQWSSSLKAPCLRLCSFG
eukprot:6214147-Pleurochrysis_carterae.AAC.1